MYPKENRVSERVVNGLLKENPTFVLMLGMCPTLAVTTSAVNGLGMGLTTLAVLALSNLLISLLRNTIPDRVRIPAFIVIIATFVTVVELLLKAYIPFLYDALGLYIPLIVVNCIILGRAEAYASKYKAVLSFFDGVGMGLGFSVALTIIGAIREVLGAGELFGHAVMPAGYVPSSIFVMAPGAFLVLACLTAIQNKVKRYGEKKGKDMSRIQSGCSTDCMNCEDTGCHRRVFRFDAGDVAEAEEITDSGDADDTFEFIDLDEEFDLTEQDGTEIEANETKELIKPEEMYKPEEMDKPKETDRIIPDETMEVNTPASPIDIIGEAEKQDNRPGRRKKGGKPQ